MRNCTRPDSISDDISFPFPWGCMLTEFFFRICTQVKQRRVHISCQLNGMNPWSARECDRIDRLWTVYCLNETNRGTYRTVCTSIRNRKGSTRKRAARRHSRGGLLMRYRHLGETEVDYLGDRRASPGLCWCQRQLVSLTT